MARGRAPESGPSQSQQRWQWWEKGLGQGYALLPSVHSVGFWGPEKPAAAGREHSRRDSSKCLLGWLEAQRITFRRGEAPGPGGPPAGGAASPASPAPCSCGRKVCGWVAVAHPHLGGPVSAFTKCRSTCLQGVPGSEPRLALEHGHQSENLPGGKHRVSQAAPARGTGHGHVQEMQETPG